MYFHAFCVYFQGFCVFSYILCVFSGILWVFSTLSTAIVTRSTLVGMNLQIATSTQLLAQALHTVPQNIDKNQHLTHFKDVLVYTDVCVCLCV